MGTYDFLDQLNQLKSQEVKIEHLRNTFKSLMPNNLNFIDLKFNLREEFYLEILDQLSKSPMAQIFWISFFKHQVSCTIDDFYNALKQMYCLNAAE